MSSVLLILAGAFALLGLWETACYWFFYDNYYQFGPVAQREEWQSGVPVEVAHSAMGRLLDTGEIAGSRRGDIYCFRQDGWEWTPMPRSVVIVVEGIRGAAFVHEVRQFFGVLWFALGFAGWMASSGHEAFGAFIALLAPFYQLTAWRINLKAWGRLRSIRRALRLVGVQVCEHCGYDLHGLPVNHECPECGRFSDGKQGRPNPDRIRRCIDQRVDARRGQAVVHVMAGLLMWMLNAGVWTLAGLLIVGRRGMKSFELDTAFWGIFTVIALVMLVVMVVRRRMEIEDEELEMPEPGGGYHLKRIEGLGFVGKVMARLLLLGPELVLNGLSCLRGERTSDSDLERAVRILTEMMGRMGGMPWEDLRGREDSLDEVHRTVQWLNQQGWIGFSERGRRVFLYTQSRNELHAGE
ncbi:MAG: hypothetical protein AABZ08_11775 [Planctomycetota bacterium]